MIESALKKSKKGRSKMDIKNIENFISRLKSNNNLTPHEQFVMLRSYAKQHWNDLDESAKNVIREAFGYYKTKLEAKRTEITQNK